jgi:hypothetical protein
MTQAEDRQRIADLEGELDGLKRDLDQCQQDLANCQGAPPAATDPFPRVSDMYLRSIEPIHAFRYAGVAHSMQDFPREYASGCLAALPDDDDVLLRTAGFLAIEHYGLAPYLGRTVDDIGAYALDPKTGRPLLLEMLLPAARAWLDSRCRCQGDPAWERMRLTTALADARLWLLRSTTRAVGAQIMVASLVYFAATGIFNELDVCSEPGAGSAPLERWATHSTRLGSGGSEPWRVIRYHELTTYAVSETLALLPTATPTDSELDNVAGAIVAAGEQPVPRAVGPVPGPHPQPPKMIDAGHPAHLYAAT